MLLIVEGPTPGTSKRMSCSGFAILTTTPFGKPRSPAPESPCRVPSIASTAMTAAFLTTTVWPMSSAPTPRAIVRPKRMSFHCFSFGDFLVSCTERRHKLYGPRGDFLDDNPVFDQLGRQGLEKRVVPPVVEGTNHSKDATVGPGQDSTGAADWISLSFRPSPLD